MENIHTVEHKIPMSKCDFSYRLGIAQTAELFMDAATEHSAILGVGLDVIEKKGYFWLAARAKYRFYRFPGALEDTRVTTWPAKVRCGICNRYYTLTAGEELLAEGRTEWAVFNRETGRIDTSPDEIFLTMPYREETVCDGRMTRVNRDFTTDKKLGTYKVRSVDIDVGRHMDNVNYIRAILAMFTTSQLAAMEVRELEITYVSQSMEGEELSIFARETEGGMQFGVFHEDGTISAAANMIFASAQR